MKLPNKLWLRILVGLVLLLIAAGISLFIKESLDEQDPETSLPLIYVTYDGTDLPGVYRAGYSWSFFTTIAKNTPTLAPEDIPLTPVDMYAGTELKIHFSSKQSTLKISLAEGQYSNDYTVLSDVDNGVLNAPSSAGVYVYRVEASWSSRGSIIYYFCVRIL